MKQGFGKFIIHKCCHTMRYGTSGNFWGAKFPGFTLSLEIKILKCGNNHLVKEFVPWKFICEKLESGNHRKFCPSKTFSYMVVISICMYYLCIEI